MTTVIKVENISKQYLISHQKKERYSTFSESLTSFAQQMINRIVHPLSPVNSDDIEIFDALKDISFEIKQGDRVGIIGRNGAGKSTLLKILSRITAPSKGEIGIKGRVASLLEVGTGFHPELTGRENIYLNGAILGMTKRDIQEKFDEIVAFSEIEKFLDTPVKRYSSGMYVRLAFAIAAHLEPEILIVDEVLAVGDARFQKKCLGKMNDVSKEGRTILFVSHNIQAVKQLCNKFMYLQDGTLVDIGVDTDIISNYLNGSQDLITSRSQIRKKIDGFSSDPVFKLIDVNVTQNNKSVYNFVGSGDDLHISVDYEVFEQLSGLRLYFDLVDDLDTLIFRSFHDESHEHIPITTPGRYNSVVVLPKDILGPISYTLKVSAGIHNVRNLFVLEYPLTVENSGLYNRAYLGDSFRGRLGIHLSWHTKCLEC